MSGECVPRATARLQFHAGFTLDDAVSVVPYLADLGISHVYASPLLKARRGSKHGYDVVDCGAINPELGGRAALERLAEALARRGMGIVLDIVPNHMAADASENAWWRDVLARGRASSFAAFFDIDWRPADRHLAGKILLPVLGRPYAEALGRGEIGLRIDAAGTAEIAYFAHSFPVAEASDPALVAAAANDPAALDRLLAAQHYRLTYWKDAGDTINWRRFFNITGLVALNAERADVFAATHAAILELFANGVIDGVRVDHVDGLADPAGYCRRLRRALAMRGRKRGALPYIVVEKILAPGEALRADWDVNGSSGYDFMDEASAVLHDPRGDAPLSLFWGRIAGGPADFPKVAIEARREILDDRFAADLERVVRAFEAGCGWKGRTIPRAAIRRIVAEVVAHFSAYRMYVDAKGAGPADRRLLEDAIEAACLSLGRGDRELLPYLRKALLAPPRRGAGERVRRRGPTRFQQLTATIAAKAVEDTAFYRYGRLLSRNEVGSDPDVFAISPKQFHAAAAVRFAKFPHALLATATHDHKRGEDVRARLAVLSEIPSEWMASVACWMRRNDGRRRIAVEGPAPISADELMLYQTLVAAWPATLDPRDTNGVTRFGERVAAWQEKAVREAKRRSDWLAIDRAYEDACRGFLAGMLADAPLREDLARFARRIGPAGAVNGLAQTMLRLTVPGVPDLYQGTEFWDENLVDPDNRRPVDFTARAAALRSLRPLSELLESWRDGRVKQALIARVLGLRKRFPGLFAAGSYLPLEAKGVEAKRALFFMRVHEEGTLLVGVARLTVPLLGAASAPRIAAEAWSGTCLGLPRATAGGWRNVLEPGAAIEGGVPVPLGLLLGALPVACWITEGAESGRVFDLAAARR